MPRSAAASPCTLPTRRSDIIKRGPTVVEAVHVGEPTLDDPTRTLAPDVTNQNKAMFMEAVNAGKPQPPAAGRHAHRPQ